MSDIENLSIMVGDYGSQEEGQITTCDNVPQLEVPSVKNNDFATLLSNDDFRTEVANWVAQNTATVQQVVENVVSIGSFHHALTEERAMAMQNDLNVYNNKHPTAKICLCLGVEEGGFSWHVWGPIQSLNIDECSDLCRIFRRYMSKAERKQFDAKMTETYPFYDFCG